MPDDDMFNTACQQATVRESAQGEDKLSQLTTADRQAIRDHARAVADAMEEEAAALWESRPNMLVDDDAALKRAVEDARQARALADALEQLERRHG